MARVLCGVPCYKPWENFIASLHKFVAQVSKKHKLTVLQVWGEQLVDAQNEIADCFLKSDNEYLLMLEDDHWGHTPEMLDALLQYNKPVTGIKYYVRHFPFPSTMMNLSGRTELGKKYISKHGTKSSGWKECDLIGFGMTLIKREVFSLLDKPYFRYNEYRPKDTYATDRDFFGRLAKKGVRPWGCLDHCLSHRGIDNDNVVEKRCDGIDIMTNTGISSEDRRAMINKIAEFNGYNIKN